MHVGDSRLDLTKNAFEFGVIVCLVMQLIGGIKTGQDRSIESTER